MKRNRLALVLSVLAAALLGLWLGPRFRRGARADSLPDLVQMAPADSTTVVYADLAALRATPWIAQLAAATPPANLDKDYADFVRGTGFAFERDLDHLVMASRPGASPLTTTLVVADGRFDRQKIGQYALRSGRLENRNGRAFYIVPSATPGKTLAITFLEGDRIALSDGGDISALLAAAAPPASSPLQAELRDRLARVAGSPLFAVVKMPEPKAGSPVQGGGPMSFQSLRWASLAARPDGGQLVLSAEGECDDADQAQKLAVGLEFFRTLLRGGLSDPKARGQMSAEGALAASRLLKDITISSNESRVRLLLNVTPETLSALTALAPAKPVPVPSQPQSR